MRAFTLTDAVDKLVSEAVVDGDCLITLRAPSANRPQVKVTGRVIYGYVAVWELAHGSVPEGCQIHHSCFVRRCVREEHLVCLTVAEHQEVHRQRVYVTVDRCAQGHLLSGENLSVHQAHPTWRKCKTCARDATARVRLRQRASRLKKKSA